jgi:hypothetical protein
VVLVFVKAGCPCSAGFEPFFQRIELLYRGDVQFADVTDGTPAEARRYARERRVPYPVLTDPGGEIVRQFGVRSGGYVVLLTKHGVMDGFWPGCSAESMQDLSRRIACLAVVAERPLDVSEMPHSLTTGCPFESKLDY